MDTSGELTTKWLTMLLDGLRQETMQALPRWHERLKTWKEMSDDKDAPFYGVRIRERELVVSIIWDLHTFYTGGGKRIRRTRALTKGKDCWSYPRRQFHLAGPEQWAVIASIEVEAARLRFDMEWASRCLLIARRQEQARRHLPTSITDI